MASLYNVQKQKSEDFYAHQARPCRKPTICAIGETDDFIYNLLLIFIIDVLVEANGIEPMTSGLQSRRSPS